MILIGILILLLFFGLRGCEHKKEKQQKEEKIEQLCETTKENVHVIYTLLEKADLCSEQWFHDVDDVIKRLEDQLIYIQKKEDKKYRDLQPLQEQLIKAIKQFHHTRNEKSLIEIQQALANYQKYEEDTCGIEGEIVDEK